MIISLLILCLIFAMSSQVIIGWKMRRAGNDRWAVFKTGSALYLPIFSVLLIIFLSALEGGGGQISNRPQLVNEILTWRNVLLILLFTSYGLIVSSDAGRIRRTTDKSMPGVKTFKPFFPLSRREISLMPVVQSPAIRRSRALMSCIGVLFALNSVAIIAAEDMNSQIKLKYSGVVFAPAAISMMATRSILPNEVPEFIHPKIEIPLFPKTEKPGIEV